MIPKLSVSPRLAGTVRAALLAWPLLGLAAPVAAVELRPDHPERYTVAAGDTLWSIAGRYLDAPWRWPELWEANPDVADPNRIHPGDVLTLVYRDGEPRLRVERGMREVRLSPRVRVTEMDRAIPTIPINAIAPFLTRPVVTEASRIDAAPYVVGFPEERAVAGLGDRIFVRALHGQPGDRFEILRPGAEYRDFESGERLGFQAAFVATARLDRAGDPATLTIIHSAIEVAIGDRVRSAVAEEPLGNFMPHPVPAALRGHVIGVLGGVSRIGQFDVVVLDRGSVDDVTPGAVFGVYSGGDARQDQVRARAADWNWRNESPLDSSFWYGDWKIAGWLRDRIGPNAPLPPHVEARRGSDQFIVPDTRAGLLMVFRVFERVSFALAMEASNVMQVGAIVAAPGD